MKKKLSCFFLALALMLSLTGCGDDLATVIVTTGSGNAGIISSADGPTEIITGNNAGESAAPNAGGETAPDYEEPGEEVPLIDEDGTYNSAEDVALYLDTYGHLPENYITKDEARTLGWTGGSVEKYAPGCAIGGDKFGNREGILPQAEGRQYYECDIDTIGENSRGAKRLVYSNDGLIYYTEDHYESFTLLYGEEQP